MYLKVMGLNEDGNNLGYNGVYELVYQDNNELNHKYRHLGDSNIVIERNNGANWVLKYNNAIVHQSGRRVDEAGAVTYLPAECPVNAGDWTYVSNNEPSFLSVSCSTGTYTNPRN